MSALLYALLTVLLVVLLLLVLPVPALSVVFTPVLPLLDKSTYPLILFMSCVVVVLCSNHYFDYRHFQSSSGAAAPLAYARSVESERDVLVALFCFLLVGGIKRASSIHKEKSNMEKKLVAMEKQARGASAAYLSQLSATPASASNVSAGSKGQQTQQQSQSSSSSSHSSSGEEELIERLTIENNKLKREMEKMQSKLTQASTQTAVAAATPTPTPTPASTSPPTGSAQSSELAATKAEVARLQKIIADLREKLTDYELVLGDSKKKKI